MKKKLTEELVDSIANARRWIDLQIEYCKLTAAEKAAVLTSAAVAGAICLLLAGIVLVLLSMCLVTVFEQFLSPCLSYLCVAGIYMLLMAVVILLRKPLIGNFVARFITKLFIEKKEKK